MEILFNTTNQEYNLKINKNCIIFGSNNSGKTKLLQEIYNALNGKNNAIINSLKITKEDNDVILFNEETDFNQEFSFTKNNIFKETIYNSILNSINKEQLLQEVNNTFDKIDKKVNNYLDTNLNLFFDNNIKFDINIDDLDQIINKFTSVYINDLNDTKKIPKSTKRILLYQLTLLNNTNKEKFILIDNFDLYMDTTSIINILNFISKCSSDKCHFILTTTNPLVYNYLDSTYIIYKIKQNKLIPHPDIKEIIKDTIMTIEYNKTKEIDYQTFYNQNINLITDKDILDFKNNIYNYNKTNIGIILTSNKINLNTLNIKTPEEQEFLKQICQNSLTDY